MREGRRGAVGTKREEKAVDESREGCRKEGSRKRGKERIRMSMTSSSYDPTVILVNLSPSVHITNR